jgi:hypothetical protein
VSYITAMGFEVKCVPVLDRMCCCCCSCDLRIASCILGWLDLVSLLFALKQEFFVHPQYKEKRLVTTLIPRMSMRKLLTLNRVTKDLY